MNTKKIIQIANEIFEGDCLSKSRLLNNVYCRFAAANFIKMNCGYMSYHSMGRLFNKNHSSIIHYVKSHIQEYKYNREYREKYDILVEKISESIPIDYAKNLTDKGIFTGKSKGRNMFRTATPSKKYLFATNFTSDQLRAIALYIDNNPKILK